MNLCKITADEALQKLIDGNKAYIIAEKSTGDISPEIRKTTCEEGQTPYAVIVACSDSRVIPESIFGAGIGDLFVIVVLGHNRCGAVDAAMHHEPSGYIKYIVDDILEAIGDEKDVLKACCLNVRHAVRTIENNIDIQRLERERGLRVKGALYRIDTGEVEMLTERTV